MSKDTTVKRLKGMVPCPMCFPTKYNTCSLCKGTEWVTLAENVRQYENDWFLAPHAKYSEVRGNLQSLLVKGIDDLGDGLSQNGRSNDRDN